MIEAGVAALLACAPWTDTGANYWKTVTAIFRAMTAASPTEDTARRIG
jgi:hypothetical protein